MPLWLAGLIVVLGVAVWVFGKWMRWRSRAALINRAAALGGQASGQTGKKIWRIAGALLFLSALVYILLAFILLNSL